MHGDVGSGIAASNPLGELPARNRFRFEQSAVAVVDVLQDTISDQRPHFLVIGVEQFVIHDLGEQVFLAGNRLQLIQFLQFQNRRLLNQQMSSGFQDVFFAASKCRSSGVATQAKSSPESSI